MKAAASTLHGMERLQTEIKLTKEPTSINTSQPVRAATQKMVKGSFNSSYIELPDSIKKAPYHYDTGLFFKCTQGRTNVELFERGYPISSEQLFMIFILGYEALIRF